jgi:Caudovirus prohead serine protease
MSNETSAPKIETMAYGLGSVRSIPPAVVEFYKTRACCTACRQRIGDTTPAIKGNRIFHQRCLQQRGARPTAPALPTPTPAPSVIGILRGSAGTFDRHGGGGTYYSADDYQLEAWGSGCFDRSLSRGGQHLCLNHGATIDGRFLSLAEDAGLLRFRFEIADTILGRSVFSLVRSQKITRCSARYSYHPRATRFVGSQVLTIVEGDLAEISVLHRAKPAWFDTFVTVEP